MNLQNLQRENGNVINDQNNADYGEGNKDSTTVKFETIKLKPLNLKSLNQIFLIIQTHIFL